MSANTGNAHTQAGDGSHIFPQENDYHALFEDITEDKERFLATLNQEVDINAKQPPYGETALHLAARKAHKSIVEFLLNRGANLEILDDDGWTPLISACRGGSQEVVELLLERIAILAKATRDPSQDTAPQDDSNIGVPAAASTTTSAKSYINISGRDGSTALTMACWMSTAEVVGSLLDKEANVDAQDDDGDTPLILAARHGNTKMVENVLSYDPDIRKFRNDGQSALHQAIQNDNEEDGESIVDRLLEAGLSSSHKDNEGSTPLHIASDYNCLSIVNKLLNLDELKVNAQNYDKETPLHLACKKGHLNVVQRLTECPCIELNFQSASSATPLFLAVENEHLEVVTKLLDQTSIDSNAPDYSKSTPLHVACREGFLEIVEKLIKVKEIQLNARDLYTRTPIFWAIIGQHSEVVQTLLNQTGLDLGTTDYAKRTPLHEASEIGSLKIVEMITNKTREQINAQDESGLTPLHLACRSGHISVAKHLFSKGAKSRVSRDSTQSAWFFFVQYLFESYEDSKSREGSISSEDSESREGSISSEDSSMPDPREFEFILEHADKEERASATIWADNKDKRAYLAHAMRMDVSRLVDYELVRWAKSLDSSDKAKIVKVLQRVITFETWPTSALQWAAYHGRYDVVWWILKNGVPEENDTTNAKAIAEKRRDQPISPNEVHTEGTRDTNEEKKDFNLTVDMLTDPPVVEGAHSESYRKPITSDAPQNVLGAHRATIVDFYERDGRVDLLRRSESVSKVIYSRTGPDNEAMGPEGIMYKARSDSEKISAEGAREKRYEKNDLRMRWIHLPANNMEWMEDLAKRIFTDKKVPASEWLSLNEFLQRSWHELPTETAPERFMKPGCLKEPALGLQRITEKEDLHRIERRSDRDGSRKADTTEETQRPQVQQSLESKKKTKDGRKEDYATGGKAAGNGDPVHGGAVAQRTAYERMALYMPYINFDLCHRKPCAASIGKEGEAPRKGIKEHETDVTAVAPPSNDPSKYEQLIETYKGKTIHATRSLDEFFYNSLLDMDIRDQNQVFTRSFFSKRNGDGVPEDQNSWPYLVVGQLWLWVIDEETIITSSTHRKDDLDDPVFERLFIQLRQARMRKNGQPPPSSVEYMSHFMVRFCIDFFHSLKWKDFSKQPITRSLDDKFSSMSVHLLYEENIKIAATKEKKLYFEYNRSMNEKESALRKHKNNLEIAHRYDNRELATSSDAAELLDEVKDILDELTILKTLVTQQLDVWKDLMGDDSGAKNAHGPAHTLRGVREMIEMAERVQESAINMLSLEQARESARQGTILMAFTIVTIIFVRNPVDIIRLLRELTPINDAFVLPDLTLRTECHSISA